MKPDEYTDNNTNSDKSRCNETNSGQQSANKDSLSI